MSEKFSLPETSRILRPVTTRLAILLIAGISILALAFLFWLIYFSEGAAAAPHWVKNLNAVNASLNLLSTVFLLMGFREIKRRNFQKHMRFMLSAFVTSALFMVSYVVYHHYVGDTKFLAEGFIRYIYFFILITHIILSVFVVPLVLGSFYFSLSGNFQIHKKVSRITFPVWLYVSVTGVLVFIMLKLFN